MVYIISKSGKPLMPTERHGKAAYLLKSGKAKVVKREPFTIQLLYDTTEHTQDVTLGIDTGYQNIGFSAVTDKQELISGEVKLDSNMSKRLQDKAMFRRTRRSKLRYRKPRFLNRVKPEGWLPPSIQRRFDTHLTLINKLKAILPISKVTVEVANFDIQKIKNPDIYGINYQQGDLYNYQNIKSYLIAREKGLCQLCNKKYSKTDPWKTHHIIPTSQGGTNTPSNLSLLHKRCHGKLHKEHLEHLLKANKQYKESTFMSIIRWKFKQALNCNITFGNITFVNRNKLELEKSHINDAFVIAGGEHQLRTKSYQVSQRRKNNRRLQIQRRDGIRIRRQRYFHQAKDLVKYLSKIYEVSFGGKSYIGLKDIITGKSTYKVIKKLDPWILHRKTLIWQFV